MQSRKIKLTLIQHCWEGDFVSAWWSIQWQIQQPILSCQRVNFGTPNPTTLPKYLKHQINNPFHQPAQHHVL
jgi:hypothetical protein